MRKYQLILHGNAPTEYKYVIAENKTQAIAKLREIYPQTFYLYTLKRVKL